MLQRNRAFAQGTAGSPLFGGPLAPGRRQAGSGRSSPVLPMFLAVLALVAVHMTLAPGRLIGFASPADVAQDDTSVQWSTALGQTEQATSALDTVLASSIPDTRTPAGSGQSVLSAFDLGPPLVRGDVVGVSGATPSATFSPQAAVQTAVAGDKGLLGNSHEVVDAALVSTEPDGVHAEALLPAAESTQDALTEPRAPEPNAQSGSTTGLAGKRGLSVDAAAPNADRSAPVPAVGLGGARNTRNIKVVAATVVDGAGDDAPFPGQQAATVQASGEAAVPSLVDLARDAPVSSASEENESGDGLALGIAMACDSWTGEHVWNAPPATSASGDDDASSDGYSESDAAGEEVDDSDDPAVTGGLPHMGSAWVAEQLSGLRAHELQYAREAAPGGSRREELCGRQRKRLQALRAGSAFGYRVRRIPQPQPLSALRHASELYAGEAKDAPPGHDASYAWPLPYVWPLPSIVQAGCDDSESGGGSSGGASGAPTGRIPCVRTEDAMAHVSTRYGDAPRRQGDAPSSSSSGTGSGSLWGALGLHPAEALSVDVCSSQGSGGSKPGVGEGSEGPTDTRRAGGAHLPRRLLLGITARTLQRVSPAEVAFLRRTLPRTCRAIARASRARVLQSVAAVGQYLATGRKCSSAAVETMTSGGCAALDAAGAASSSSSAAGVAGIGSLRKRMAAVQRALSAASSPSAASAYAGLRLIVLDVRGSDAVAVARLAARSAAAHAEGRTSPDAAHTDATSESAEAAGLVGEWTADALARAMPNHVRPGRWQGHEVLRQKLGDVRRARGALGPALGHYARTLLPHEDSDEGYELRIATGTALQGATARSGGSGSSGGSTRGVRAVVTSPTVWGAVRALSTLSGVLEGLPLQEGAAPSAGDYLLQAIEAASGGGAAAAAAGEALHSHGDGSGEGSSAKQDHPSHRAGHAFIGSFRTDSRVASAALRAATGLCGGCAVSGMADLIAQAEADLRSHAAERQAASGDGAAAAAPSPAFIPRSTLAVLDPALGSPTVSLPLVIVDRPWKPWRGFLMDTSRHWLHPATIRRTIDAAAAVKLNILHWHISDAVAFPLHLASFPDLATGSAWHEGSMTYSRADVARIVRYAADRGVRVIAEFDTPSHTRALGALGMRKLGSPPRSEAAAGGSDAGGGSATVAVAAVPFEIVPIVSMCAVWDDCGANRSYAGKGGDTRRITAFPSWETAMERSLGDSDTSQCLRSHNSAVLDPTRDETYVAIAALYAEFADVFPDATLHVGADEVLTHCFGSIEGGKGGGVADMEAEIAAALRANDPLSASADAATGEAASVATTAAASDPAPPPAVVAAAHRALARARSSDSDKSVAVWAKARLPHLLLPGPLRCLARNASEIELEGAAAASLEGLGANVYPATALPPFPATPGRTEFPATYAAATAYLMRQVVTVVGGVLGKAPMTWSDAALELVKEWGSAQGVDLIDAGAACAAATENRDAVAQLVATGSVKLPQAPAAAASGKGARGKQASMAAPPPPHPYRSPFFDGDVSSRPHASFASYGSPRGVGLQSWRCWDMRFERELVSVARDDLNRWEEDSAAEAADAAAGLTVPELKGVPPGRPFTGPRDLRPLLQSACWYLDDNANTWQVRGI